MAKIEECERCRDGNFQSQSPVLREGELWCFEINEKIKPRGSPCGTFKEGRMSVPDFREPSLRSRVKELERKMNNISKAARGDEL